MTDPIDGPCVVCGESVVGRAYVSLRLFGVWLPSGWGISFDPSGDPRDYDEWDDVPQRRFVCAVTCVQAYVDGVVADAAMRMRREPEGGGPRRGD